VAQLKIRNLDERVARALRARAREEGISLEEAARRALAESVALARRVFARRAQASRAASRRRTRGASDSTAIIRRERDAWG
jgi:plasmid stability protein